MHRLILALLICVPLTAASAQTVVQSRGVDARVDYRSLTQAPGAKVQAKTPFVMLNVSSFE